MGTFVWRPSYRRPDRPLRFGSEFDVVSNVICPWGEPVIESAGAVIVFMCMPVDAPPTLLFSESDKRLDQRPSCSAATCFGHDEQVFKITDRSEAPGMRVEDIIGESNWFARALTGEKAPDRLVRRENALPEPLRNFVGDRAIERRAITAPEGKPSVNILGSGPTARSILSTSRTLFWPGVRQYLLGPPEGSAVSVPARWVPRAHGVGGRST
jgi:hypothetical protein